MQRDDQFYIQECLRGRREAFDELVKLYYRRLYNAVYRLLGHAEDAADVVQEAFANAFVSLASFKGEAGFYTWLYRIAFNLAVSWQRKRRDVVQLDALDGDQAWEPADPSEMTRPERRLEAAENELGLQAALSRLSFEHRMVLILKDIEDMRYDQIAEILRIPIGTVRSRLHRARAELRQILQMLEEEQPATLPPSSATNAISHPPSCIVDGRRLDVTSRGPSVT